MKQDRVSILLVFVNSCPSSAQCEMLMKAMRYYHDHTCVRFKEWTGEPNRIDIYFNPDDGACWSMVGRSSLAVQKLSLGYRCWYLGIVLHELGHTVGFWHEMTRFDRDKYIRVLWENIQNGSVDQFSVREKARTLNEPFDYKSIMLYDEFAFTKYSQLWWKLTAHHGNIDIVISRNFVPLYLHACIHIPGEIFTTHKLERVGGGGESNLSSDELCTVFTFLVSHSIYHVWKELQGYGELSLLKQLFQAYLSHVTDLKYDPEDSIELWQTNTNIENWTYVELSIYTPYSFKGLGRIYLEEVYLKLCGGRLENHLRKTTLGISDDQDSNLNLPVIGSLVYCESSVLDHAATKQLLSIQLVPVVCDADEKAAIKTFQQLERTILCQGHSESHTTRRGGHESPALTPRSPAVVDKGIHYAVPYSAVGSGRGVVIAYAPDDLVGAGLRPTEKSFRQTADTAVQGREA
uniref:Metalloendopeptidase n=1 Tax=Timema bartmani TaxID=61472 RepID=A0A7R9HZE0_9NEOP|nr:unnamed protein product [Timema bartmani]